MDKWSYLYITNCLERYPNIFYIVSFLVWCSCGIPWVFRERAPRAPHFFQLWSISEFDTAGPILNLWRTTCDNYYVILIINEVCIKDMASLKGFNYSVLYGLQFSIFCWLVRIQILFPLMTVCRVQKVLPHLAPFWIFSNLAIWSHKVVIFSEGITHPPTHPTI